MNASASNKSTADSNKSISVQPLDDFKEFKCSKNFNRSPSPENFLIPHLKIGTFFVHATDGEMFTPEGVEADTGDCVRSGVEGTSLSAKSDSKLKISLYKACLSVFVSSMPLFNLCTLPDTCVNRVFILLKSSLFLAPSKLLINCVTSAKVSLISPNDST